MRGIFLTIVTVTKDDPIGLGRTLVSATALRAAGAEHLVIDGGIDPDTTLRIVAESGEGIIIISRSPQGIADAFNRGLSAARGEWMWFLNGGDLIDARLEPEILVSLLGNTKAEVIIGGLTYEGELDPRPHPLPEKRWPSISSWIPHPATLVRRRMFEQHGRFDARYRIAMDYEWWLRALGPHVAVDVLSLPFAVFALGGISQRPEMREIIRREKLRAISRHCVSIAGQLVRQRVQTLFSEEITYSIL
jgi:glycosyltransferase involved in cell wall biosynthesis